jgi:hypothetical protein
MAAALSISTVCMPQDSAKTLQQRADAAGGAQCAQLGMQIARISPERAHQLFNSGDSSAAQESLGTMLHYAKRSVDCALLSRKREKPTEIELRGLVRRTREVVRTVDSEQREQFEQATDALERERDRLLQAIFGTAATGAAR